jgi:uncharacterized protein
MTDTTARAFIDCHVHARKTHGLPRFGGQAYASPEQLMARQDELDIESSVILPGTNPEHAYHIQSNEEVLEICAEHPGRFIPFCNIHPRQLTNTPDAPLGDLMRFYKDKGCKGIGEVTANMPIDDPFVQNLFKHAQDVSLPVTFHLGPQIDGCYGLVDEPGLPGLERALAAFPDLIFLGHSQPFWAEIGPVEPAERNGYPEGPVESDGRVVELMRAHPNLYGDLSAGSGHNAVSRDEAFGVRFLTEFQDRLLFGTDICAPTTAAPLGPCLKRLRDESKLTPATFHKIARRNAERLFDL